MDAIVRWFIRGLTRIGRLFQYGQIHYASVMYGFVGSRVLMTALELGVFDALEDGPRGRDEVAKALGLDPEAVRIIFDTCVLHNLMGHRRGRYWLRRSFAKWLQGDGVRADILHFRLMYDDLSNLEACTRGVWPKETGVANFWGRNYSALTPEESARYTDFMRGTVSRSAAAVVKAYDFGKTNSVLDVGGGSGTLALAIAEANPQLRVGILDLPGVEPRARALLDAAGRQDQVVFHPGNFFEEPIPEGWETMLLHRVLWDWTDEYAARLLQNIYTCLPPGGKLLVTEGMWCGDDDVDVFFSSFHLYLCLGGFRLRTRDEVRTLLKAAGFVGFEERIVSPVFMPMIVATKPELGGS